MAIHPDRRRLQPARVHLFAARLSVRAAAEQIGVTTGHLRNVIAGTAAPSPEVRERLPQLLGVPLDQLFEADLLAKEWRGTNKNASASHGKGGPTFRQWLARQANRYDRIGDLARDTIADTCARSARTPAELERHIVDVHYDGESKTDPFLIGVVETIALAAREWEAGAR